ncbi:mitochondrial carrier domain-containing protein [Lactarius quietus]|nr:mitochondrial carrier domain-containing protein [Lactarius quietus]
MLQSETDHASTGIDAGTSEVLCMNPLDLLKVKFQVSTRGPEGGIGRGIGCALYDIHAGAGWRALYRELGPKNLQLRSVQAAGINDFVTAILPNPIWIGKVRTFIAPPDSSAAHRSLWRALCSCGFREMLYDEGWRGLYHGTSLELFSVSNGALQLMRNEKMTARSHHHTITSTLAHTWTHESFMRFYRGLTTNLVRVLRGTCVTFVVYGILLSF